MNYLVNYKDQPANHMRGMFRGGSCFLLCGGPSLSQHDLTLLQQRGILTAAVNNCAAVTFRPQLWFTMDHQYRFSTRIWNDPGIMKFARLEHLYRTLNEWDGEKWVNTERMPRHCPNVWGYRHSVGWNADDFLSRERPTVGTDSAGEDPTGQTWHKSVMFPTLRILFDLGVRRLYLLGCDFQMTEQQPYCFDEYQPAGEVAKNNDLFDWLNKRFLAMREHFAEHKFQVFNCTPGGNLTAFERMPFENAVLRESKAFKSEPVLRGQYR